MRCEDAHLGLSARLDGEPGSADLEAHVGQCAACAAYARGLNDLRRRLRFEVVDADRVPDVAPAVLAAVGRSAGQAPALRHAGRARWRAAAPYAAVFVAAYVAGATFVGVDPGRPAQLAAAEIPERVVAAQTDLHALTATVEVSERGWHPAVPERTYGGSLAYLAPESLALDLTDSTSYPPGQWVPNDVTAVTHDDRSWTRGPAACPREVQPGCTPVEPRLQAVGGREPFSEPDPAPLDLILPVRSFTDAAAPEPLGTRTVDGRAAVGAATTAAQIGPLLDGLRVAGNWREVYPGDRVELWLDEASLAPLRVTVLPATDDERELWAARRGYRDPPGEPILEIALRDVRVNLEIGAERFPPVPAGGRVRNAGFSDRALGAGAPQPGWLPAEMARHRQGQVGGGGGPIVQVQSWTDGRAWVKVRSTTEWKGGRLFGGPGDVVRPVMLEDGQTAYVGEGGTTVAVHGGAIDAVVTGSVGTAALIRVAAGLDIAGREVPHGWREAGAGTLRGLAADEPDALAPPPLDGFAQPAVRRDGRTVTLAYSGAGDRGFVLSQVPGTELSPPLDPDARGVQVRGVAGRYSPSLGELDWVEGDRVLSLRSGTLTLAELVAVAGRLAPVAAQR